MNSTQQLITLLTSCGLTVTDELANKLANHQHATLHDAAHRVLKINKNRHSQGEMLHADDIFQAILHDSPTTHHGSESL